MKHLGFLKLLVVLNEIQQIKDLSQSNIILPELS